MMNGRTYRLYPEAQHWCSFADYGCILDVTLKLAAKRVLEFGPGSSTLALIEGGARHVDACEDDVAWFATYCHRLEDRFPNIVHMRPYTWKNQLTIPGVDAQRYDLGLVDAPAEINHRPQCIMYALDRCAHVLVPLETGERSYVDLAGVVQHFAALHARPIQYMETGPLAGTYALLGKPAGWKPC